MSTIKNLFKQTFVYGLATVLPRMVSFLLVPLYTDILPKEEYGEISVIFAYFVLINVILAYGMETAFFRFYNKSEDPNRVLSTSGWSLVITSLLFTAVAYLARELIVELTNIPLQYIELAIWILLLDALVIIPFAWLRAAEKPMRYAIIKIFNVAVNLGLNVFFLVYLKDLAEEHNFFRSIYIENFEISYVFISNLIASGLTLLLMLPFYFRISFTFDSVLWRKMLSYGFPILIAGIAFSVNEVFDRILLDRLLPQAIAREQVGAYSACYKLAMFMTLFATAFRLGIEPFFFSHSGEENATTTYARITNYFVILGSLILLGVIVFADLLKILIIKNSAYWEAMEIVPLILLANLFLGIYHNLSVWYKVTDRTRFGGYISLAGAAVTIALNLYLIPKIGYTGSAIATLAAYGLMMLLSYYYGRKFYKVPYDMKRIGAYLLVSIVFSIISFYFFRGNYFVGIPLLLIFMGVIYYFEKDQILRIIQS
ncbi:oligosaccharide flippase family protein [Christiangramia portivictoriae]|uniref:oligosaccharide flippase family protein n=1 Tax=Christiangramia portivictoriae TaxID=326069 RepID=UPI00047B2622|nr:oligosaccharide flippase family protein [Christiangramia portivictoriae]